MSNKITNKITINGEEVDLDPKNLEVNEINLNTFLSEFATKYDYFSRRVCMATKVLHHFEDLHDVIYNKKFEFYKEEGSCSDKLAEAKTKSSEDVVDAKHKVREYKYRKELIWAYLRSMDKAHEDALNLGYNLRKEMDKLQSSVRSVVGRRMDIDE